jgi:uncharacterized membrane protein
MRLLARLATAAMAGLITAVIVGWGQGWWYAVPAGWIAAAGVYLASTWLKLRRLDAAATEAHATLRGEDSDSNRATIEWSVLTASLASLAGVGCMLVAKQGDIAAAVVGVLSVAASWVVVHTTFMLRYARLYYPDRGIDFNQHAPPTYTDFAYLAFTVGMSYAVSDTNIRNPEIRRTVLYQALVSFLLGAIILATTINLIGGLLDLGN